MRPISLVLAAAATLGVAFVCTPPALALTAPQPGGLQNAIEGVDVFEQVHCRRYRHRHRYGHRWGFGCRTGAIIVTPGISTRTRIHRDRTRVRDRGAITRPRVRTETAPRRDITVRGKTDTPAAKGPQDTTARAKGNPTAKDTPSKK
jgi:hypothetical protein